MNVDPNAGGPRRPRPPGGLAHALGAANHPPDLQHLTGGAQGPPQPAGIDLTQDPILQQIQAVNQRRVQGAQADELAGRKQALIAYGYDPSLDALYPDDATRQAAMQNPFSVLATQKHDYEQRTNTLEDNLNRGNLFYSSTRGTQLGENAHAYQERQAGATGQLNNTLTGLQRALLGVQQGAEDANTQGLADAYGRYVPPNTPTTVPGHAAAPPHLPTMNLATFLQPQRRTKPPLMPE